MVRAGRACRQQPTKQNAKSLQRNYIHGQTRIKFQPYFLNVYHFFARGCLARGVFLSLFALAGGLSVGFALSAPRKRVVGVLGGGLRVRQGRLQGVGRRVLA